jgi:hypothetical protein
MLSKTPDFSVDGDAKGYLVEVKAREDSQMWNRHLDSGQVARQRRSMGYGDWTEKVAKDAVKQFLSLDDQHLRWWVLWLAIECIASPEPMCVQAVGTLFGARQVVYYDPQSMKHISRNCLFARPGVFERHREIVASVVDSGSALCLCVNEEADDFSSFQESVLWSHLAFPTTATDLAGKHGWLRVDLSVDRKDDSALAAHLEQAYGLKKAIMLDTEAHSASIVPSLWKDNRT